MSGPLEGILAGLARNPKIRKIWSKCAVAVVARAWRRSKKTLQLEPGTVFFVVEKISREYPKSMHANLPVHGEGLHDRDDPRVLDQPLGGKHTAVDVSWGRASEQVLLA